MLLQLLVQICLWCRQNLSCRGSIASSNLLMLRIKEAAAQQQWSGPL
jgi:hypothetical protein